MLPVDVLLNKNLLVPMDSDKNLFEATYKNRPVLVKKFGIKLSQSEQQEVLSEAEAHMYKKGLCKLKNRSLQHQNIAACVGYSFVDELVIALECQPNQMRLDHMEEMINYHSLFEWIQKQQLIEYEDILDILHGIAFGLSYLHSRIPDPIVHHNLTSHNILVFI